MEFLIGLVVGAVVGVGIAFFVFKNNKKKFMDTLDKAFDLTDEAHVKIKKQIDKKLSK